MDRGDLAEIELVTLTDVEVKDAVVARESVLIGEDVRFSAAGEYVVARSTDDLVLTGTALDGVVAELFVEPIRATVALDRGVAQRTGEAVVAVVASERVDVVSADKPFNILDRANIGAVIGLADCQIDRDRCSDTEIRRGIKAVATFEHVVAATRIEVVTRIAADEDVVVAVPVKPGLPAQTTSRAPASCLPSQGLQPSLPMTLMATTRVSARTAAAS